MTPTRVAAGIGKHCHNKSLAGKEMSGQMISNSAARLFKTLNLEVKTIANGNLSLQMEGSFNVTLKSLASAMPTRNND